MTFSSSIPMSPKWLFRGAVLLLTATLAGLCYYIFCSYEAFFHSDAAIANILAEEIVRTGELFPGTWWYVNNDIWVFYKHLFLIPWVLAGENGFFAYGVSVLLSVVITMALLVMLLRAMDLSKTAALMGCVAISLGYSPMYLREVYGEAAYTWYFAFILSFLLLILKASRPHPGKFTRPALIAVFLGLAYLVVLENPVRFVVYYLVPFCGAFVALLYAERQGWIGGEKMLRREALLPWAIPAAAFAATLMLGVVSYKLLLAGLHHAPGANKAMLVPLQGLPLHAAYAVLGVINFIGAEWGEKIALASVGGVAALLKLGLYPLALVLPGYYAVKNVSRLSLPQRYFLALSYFGFALIFFLYAVSTLHHGAFEARNNIRYIIPFLMMILVCPVVIWRFLPRFAKGVLIAALVLAIAGSWGNISPAGWRETVKERSELIAALKSRGLVSGYAPYWDSHVYTVLSKGEVKIRPVEINWRGVGLCWWLTSEYWHDKGYSDGKVFFMVPNESLGDWKAGLEKFSLPQVPAAFSQGNFTIFVFPANPLPEIKKQWRPMPWQLEE